MKQTRISADDNLFGGLRVYMCVPVECVVFKHVLELWCSIFLAVRGGNTQHHHHRPEALQYGHWYKCEIIRKKGGLLQNSVILLYVSCPSANEFSAILFLLFARSSSNPPRSLKDFRQTLMPNFIQIHKRVKNFPIDPHCKNCPLSATL